MSKVVIIEAELGASQIIKDLLEKFAAKNPHFAQWLEKIEPMPIITECAINAIQRMKEYGVKIGSHASLNGEDYTNYNGKIIGALKTDKLPTGLGIVVADQGTIRFVADGNYGGAQAEAKRLQDLFEKIFLQEIVKAFLQIFGYQVKISETTVGGDPAIFIEGVKQ